MKGNTLPSDTTKRVVRWLTMLVVCCGLVLVGGATRAMAAPGAPSLTLHLLKTQAGQGGTGSILPGNSNSPAGSGYVYQAVKLDRTKVRRVTAGLASSPSTVQQRLTSAVVADQASFKDPSNTQFYGASDSNGIITTSYSAQTEGVWLDGASLDVNTATLSGGTAAEFDGTAVTPSYWLVSLVAAPRGITVRTDPCVIQLPNLDSSTGSATFQVDVYPKLNLNQGNVVPGNNKVQQGSKPLASTGSPMIGPMVLLTLFLLIGTSLILVAKGRRTFD